MKGYPLSLRISGVSKTYPNGLQALQQVSLDIPAGMYGLLGPNGAGKSTLMRILATLQEPDEGHVMLGEIDVIRQKDRIRQTLGYLPQEFGLYPKAKAEELLDYFAVLKGISNKALRKDTIGHLLRQVNLWDKRKEYLGGFSGGMRQRFGVAVALLGNPQLLVVDEPTAGLDPAERLRFLNLLSELGENIVVILSTHIIEDVAELCTHMGIINKGNILLQDRTAEAVTALHGRIWQRSCDKNRMPDLATGQQLISAKMLEGRSLLHVYSEEAPGHEFVPVIPDLEDVYFSVLAGCYPGQRTPKKREVSS